MNFPAVHYSDKVFRNVAVVHVVDLVEGLLDEILNQKPLGLLFIVPENESEKASALQELMDYYLNMPVYFLKETEDLKEIYGKLKSQVIGNKGRNSASTTFQLIVTDNEPVIEDVTEAAVLMGVFSENESEMHSEKPIIVLSASYDSGSMAPGLNGDVNSASGFMAMNDIARSLRTLYDDRDLKDNSEFEMIFLLTPGASNDYELTSNFLQSLNTKVSDRIQFVLCLDHLGSSADMTLHMGATQNSEEAEQFVRQTLKNLKSGVVDMGGSLKFQKKTKPGSFYEWEHLRYQENGFTAGTLTSLEKTEFSSRFEKFSLFDSKSSFNKKAYARNVQAITEFLTRLVFRFPVDHVYSLTKDTVNMNRLENQLTFFGSTSRYLTSVTKGSNMLKELVRLFSSHIGNVRTKFLRVVEPKFFKESPRYKMQILEDEWQYPGILPWFVFAGVIYGLYQLWQAFKGK